VNAVSASAETLFYEATRLLGEGDIAAAESAFRAALKLAPDFAEVHANLGLLLDRSARCKSAEIHYRRALVLSPRQVQTHLNFGAMLAAQKRFVEAETLYRQGLSLDPQSTGIWSNLGALLASTKREMEAEQCYRLAMKLAPDYRKARFNLAYLLLRQGRYEEGWSCLEARDWYTRLENRLRFPRWQGESLEGKSLLIGFEAGHGDMIQFCRYAALAKGSGATRVSVLCHPGLKRLFATLLCTDEVIAFDEPLPAFSWDYWTPPLSLPYLFRTRLETIPANLPYLTAETERIGHWARIIGDRRGSLRVGLVWKGNPQFENDADRSLPFLATLAPLGEVVGVHYFSLQKGAGEEEAARHPQPLWLTDLAFGITDFADTAGIVMNLDLVIAVDTAVAHLAGALGKPCWVLLPDYKTDWRWLTDRDDSPWYPEVMRLFRQKTAGDWAPVIAGVKKALHTLIARTRHGGRCETVLRDENESD
jgi:Tfp pilus assembly protein PilF